MAVFMYALKAPETRRQWPRRLKVFFDFLRLEGPIEEQAKQFLIKAKQFPQWAQDSLLRFRVFNMKELGKVKFPNPLFPTHSKNASNPLFLSSSASRALHVFSLMRPEINMNEV